MILETTESFGQNRPLRKSKFPHVELVARKVTELMAHQAVETFFWDDTGAMIVMLREKLPSGAHGVKFFPKGTRLQTVVHVLRRIDERFGPHEPLEGMDFE